MTERNSWVPSIFLGGGFFSWVIHSGGSRGQRLLMWASRGNAWPGRLCMMYSTGQSVLQGTTTFRIGLYGAFVRSFDLCLAKLMFCKLLHGDVERLRWIC